MCSILPRMLPYKQQCGHDGGEGGDHGVWMLCIMQPHKPGTYCAEEHKAVFSLMCCLHYVTLSMRDTLSIGAVHHLQIVEDSEDWDGGELISD